MPVRLCRWGNSTGLRIPKVVMEAAGLAPGRAVSLRVLDNGEVRLRPVGELVLADSGGATAIEIPDERPAEW